MDSQTPFTGYAGKKWGNGKISSKIQYKDGVADGLWAQYFKNGRHSIKGTLKDRTQEGQWES